jgi:hypothetical protein
MVSDFHGPEIREPILTAHSHFPCKPVPQSRRKGQGTPTKVLYEPDLKSIFQEEELVGSECAVTFTVTWLITWPH